MPEMHLKQTGFTYNACGPSTKNKERIEKHMQTGNTDFIYENELDKACFEHDMACGKSKDLVKRIQNLIQNFLLLKFGLQIKLVKHLKLKIMSI